MQLFSRNANHYLYFLDICISCFTHLQGLLNWNHHGLRLVCSLLTVYISTVIIHIINANILYVVLLFNNFPFHLILYSK